MAHSLAKGKGGGWRALLWGRGAASQQCSVEAFDFLFASHEEKGTGSRCRFINSTST